MIAAGDTHDTGCGWLIEIYGDSLTTELHTGMETLCQATNLATANGTHITQV